MIVTGFGEPEPVIVEGPGTSEEQDDGHDYYLWSLLDLSDHHRAVLRDRLKAKEEELEASKEDREALVRSFKIVGENRGSIAEEISRVDDQQAQDGPVTIDPKVLASRLGKSLRWIYDHAGEFGAVKIGRSWIFTEEGLRDAYTRQRERTVERSNQVSRKDLPRRLSYQERGRKLGARKAGGTGRASEDAAADRHGLARLLQPVPRP